MLKCVQKPSAMMGGEGSTSAFSSDGSRYESSLGDCDCNSVLTFLGVNSMKHNGTFV